MMNSATGMAIGNAVGEVVLVDAEVDGSAVGNFLRVEVRVDVEKPLMRGIMVEEEEPEEGKWFPFQYEYLLDFCYGCGMLGHVEKECDEIGGEAGGEK